ncbi:MAG: glycosyltransferase [Rhodospirillaceae bacterium]|nr:glycosyltransferase [Rhodospirillaceae bacterium]
MVGEFPKLSETFVLDEIKEHVRNRVDVTVISLRRANVRNLAYANMAGMDLDVIDVLTKRRWAYLLELIGLGALSMLAKPVLWRVVLGHGYGSMVERMTILALAYRLRDIERAGRIDILHCHFGRQGRYAAVLRHLGILRARIVTTFHGFDISSTIARRGRHHYAELFAHGDLFLPISDYWAHSLRELGCDPGRIVVHHMGSNAARQATRSSGHRKRLSFALSPSVDLSKRRAIHIRCERWHCCARAVRTYHSCSTLSGTGR